MKLTDILPLAKWVELEKEIVERYGLDSNVFNVAGVRITEFKAWANKLCPAVKATDKGQSFICAVAHMNIAAQAMQTRKPVIEECDAGLVKIVVPIFMDDIFLGAIGSCGVILDDGEVDSFLINKMTEIEEEKAEKLAEGIGSLTSAEAEELTGFIQKKIDAIITAFKNQKTQG